MFACRKTAWQMHSCLLSLVASLASRKLKKPILLSSLMDQTIFACWLRWLARISGTSFIMLILRTGGRSWQRCALLQTRRNSQISVKLWVIVLRNNYKHKETHVSASWQVQNWKRLYLFGLTTLENKKLLAQLRRLMALPFQFMQKVCKALSKRLRSSERSSTSRIQSFRRHLIGSLSTFTASILNMLTSLRRMVSS